MMRLYKSDCPYITEDAALSGFTPQMLQRQHIAEITDNFSDISVFAKRKQK